MYQVTKDGHIQAGGLELGPAYTYARRLFSIDAHSTIGIWRYSRLHGTATQVCEYSPESHGVGNHGEIFEYGNQELPAL